MARLSIVVPYWNVERYLQSCLESLQRQTFTDFEAILVDDGSQDSSREIAEKFCAEDVRFRIVTQQNQGLGPARNTGVRAASGEFVTFVDSDDLVPRRAYQRMIESLDRTGSDLVAGDARRFNTLGVRDSYVHRHAFARQRLRTHVREYERIALDRMAWNKVFRRSFWDEQRLEFPPILYEDYPVTIRAHVLAKSVDVLADPVYYWRERDGGDQSITQRKWEKANLRDRVTSALSVLDFLHDSAPEIAPIVQAHLRKIDLSALAGAVHANDAADIPEVLELADRLRSRIAPDVLADGTPFEQIQNRLLERHDVPRLHELSRYREQHGTSARVIRGGLPRRFNLDLPFRGDRAARVPAAVYRMADSRIGLDVQVVDSAWHGSRYRLDLAVSVGSLPMSADSTVAVRFVKAGPADAVIDCTVERFTRRRQHLGADLCGVRVEIDSHDLVRPGDDPGGFWAVEVTATSHGIERTGTADTVLPGRARWPVHHELDAGLLVQPQYRTGGPFGLWVRDAPHQVTDAKRDGEDIELRGTFHGPRPESPTHLLLTRGDGATESTLIAVTPAGIEPADAPHEFRASIPARTLIDHGDHDDPVEESTAWTPRLVHDGRELVLATATASGFAGADVVVGSRRVAATRTGHGNLMIVESYAHPRITAVTWHSDDRVEVVGQHEGSGTCAAHIDLRCFVTPDDVIEHAYPTTIDDRTFRFDIDVAALVAETVAAERDAALEGRVAARWHLLAPTANGAVTVTIGRDDVHRLPANRIVHAREVALEAGRGEAFSLRVC